MSNEYYQKNLGGLSVYLRQSLETLIGKSEGTLFVLSEHLKKLDGKFVQSLLNKERLGELMSLFCKGNSGFIFDGEVLRPTEETLSATHTYDAGKILTTEEVLKMTDLQFLFSINAYDFPYCSSTVKRGVYEDFFDFLLKHVTPESHQYHLLVESIPMLRVAVQEWFAIINCVTRIFQNITTRCKAFEAVIASVEFRSSQRKDDHTMDDLVRWFDHVELLRKKDLDTKGELNITILDFAPQLAVFLESATEFKTMPMESLISAAGKGEAKKIEEVEEVYLAKIDYYHQTLFARIAGDEVSPAVDKNIAEETKALLKRHGDDLRATQDAKDFCQQAFALIGKFEDLIGQLNLQESFYLSALAEGRKLMGEVASAEAVLLATRFRSNSTHSPRPGSGDVTPRTTPRSTTQRLPTSKDSPRDQRDDLTSSNESLSLRKSSGDVPMLLRKSGAGGSTATPAEKALHRKSSGGGYSLRLWGDGTGAKAPSSSPRQSPVLSERTPRHGSSGSQSPTKK